MPNRLAAATSPYLLQHQDNPVDWYEWGEEAFEEARRRDVPILLSVGYSACHWCHVMAHESFEDEATAELMNDQFVNIKVDREERPDVDSIYMSAVQATTGHGGWPMTVWLDHDGRPFFAGTYFPKADHPGRPGFTRVLASVTDAWRHRRQELGKQAERIREAISRPVPAGEALPGQAQLAAAHDQMSAAFDASNGGFGGAPKFPQQPGLDFLLHAVGRPWAPRAAEMLETTLTAMAAGGIHDHVGGGFARYAVDSIWLVPHFEKMLYDNAQLSRIYLRASQVLDNVAFQRVAERTLEYLARDLSHPDGGFYSAEDADSEGVEGKFYVWSLEEFIETAGSVDGPIMADLFGVTEQGNFEGTSILHLAQDVAEVAREHGLTVHDVEAAHARVVDRLLERRATRVRPELDHKVVASWNGLAIRAFAEAGAVLRRPPYLDRARAAGRFLLDNLVREDGRLLRSWARGRATIPGFLEDYGAVAVGLFSLYAATGEVEWYNAASRLTRQIPDLFGDPDGGLFTTGLDTPALLIRPQDLMDNPHPSGNSLAAEAMLLLSLYESDSTLRQHAEDAVRAAGLIVERHPTAVGRMLTVILGLSDGPREVALAGPSTEGLEAAVWSLPRAGVALAVDRDGSAGTSVPLLAHRWTGDDVGYVCRDFVCAAPTGDPDALARQLSPDRTA